MEENILIKKVDKRKKLFYYISTNIMPLERTSKSFIIRFKRVGDGVMPVTEEALKPPFVGEVTVLINGKRGSL